MTAVLVIGIVVALLVGAAAGMRLQAVRDARRSAGAGPAPDPTAGREATLPTAHTSSPDAPGTGDVRGDAEAAPSAGSGSAGSGSAGVGVAPVASPAPAAVAAASTSPEVTAVGGGSTSAEAAAAVGAASTSREGASVGGPSTAAVSGASTSRQGASVGSTSRGDVLDAVWRLQLLGLEISRRREAELSTAEPGGGPIGLVQAVAQEIARIREEIGTPGELRSDLDVEPDPAVALLLLQSVQLTLDLVARRSQAFDLHLLGGEDQLEVTVLCDDFDGVPPDIEAAAIADTIASAGGHLVLDRDAEGRIVARLRVSAG